MIIMASLTDIRTQIHIFIFVAERKNIGHKIIYQKKFIERCKNADSERIKRMITFGKYSTKRIITLLALLSDIRIQTRRSSLS